MDYLETNRRAWNQRTAIHLDSAFYDVPGFLDGQSSLKDIELRELSPVSDKRLLHLQCHFGLDTLSLARLGAEVTGIDLSDAAIEAARDLSARAGIAAEFACGDVYQARSLVNGEFDIVFTSYGTIGWLPQLDSWAEAISACLAPGGRFHIVEFHPHYFAFCGEKYFSHTSPDVTNAGTYTENGGSTCNELCEWSHPLSEVINSLVKHGLSIEFLNEYDYSPYNCFEDLEEREPGKFYPVTALDVPMLFSIGAVRS